ncbi:tetratricopeptide repeat protein [Persicobacter sp. CCB-QB2]|uniref:tetratricopeptide repeat protein n=1 Tax=Persicobacter sp. CCB-QB2 TaxID=1561025 RepID=UPI0006A9E38A|nr:tetratricopeptide repeat protein [Persicobacter sp. CCB-QB2]
MKIKSLLSLLLIAGSATVSYAQAGWNWPEGQEEIAQEKNVIYTDNMKAKNYEACREPLNWLIVNAPDLNKSLYQNGAKIYDALAKKSKDKAQKAMLQDSAMLTYDLRAKYFGQKAAVIDRKVYYAYYYYKDEAEKYPEVYEMFKEAFELNGAKILDNNCVAYMDLMRRYKEQDENAISDETVIATYEQISTILDQKEAKGKNLDKLETIRENVDKLFTSIVDVDCDFIANTLGPKLEQDPNDLKLAKNIFKLSVAGRCMEDPVFLASAKVIQSQEPDFGVAKLVGMKEKQAGNYEDALAYFNQALELTDDETKKAGLFLDMADVYAKSHQAAKAREYAMKAVSADPSKKEAYTLIGNLYFSSFDKCKQNKNKVEDRAVFIAAYEMYAKAGNQGGMANAKAQFPSMEDIFTYDMNVGDPVSIGCWINKTVKVQKRD